MRLQIHWGEEKTTIREFALRVQPAAPAAVDVHPCALQTLLVADGMFAASSPSLLMYDFSCAIAQVSFPCQYS